MSSALAANTLSADILAALSQPTIDVVTAGQLLGVGRNAAYKAREAGDFPSFRVGGQWRVPTAPLREKLGIAQREEAA